PSPTTALSTLSLHDALPIFRLVLRFVDQRLGGGEVALLARVGGLQHRLGGGGGRVADARGRLGIAERLVLGETPSQLVRLVRLLDRKSTRLNSSHLGISYAV